MSDDDAATDKTTGKAEETAATDETVEPAAPAKDEPVKESAAADSGAEESVSKDAEPADETVKLSTATAKDADAKDSEKEADKAAEDETVKLAVAEETVKAAKAPKAPKAPKAVAAEPAENRTSWVPMAAAFGAGVLVVVAGAVAAVGWWQASDRGDKLDARDSAVAAACDFGHQVGTYDAKNFDDYVKRVKDRSAGDWLTQFDGASSALKQITQQAQARSTVGEIHCAFESGDANKASVVMLITQNQSKAATPTPQALTIGVVASLEKKDGKWLVDNFQSPMTNDLAGAAQAQAPGADTQQAPSTGAPQPGN
ncbi:hypothetical protein [Nocardia macrotermitis]|uniref:Mce-associated membrane protein n=1 Tax=Nocardia macrotermitis TaxID=2585198 RepID=A0A7K0DDJ1_9NOCA|nr:hypothetical protein [Nocardia macrotermitis]MQY22934.1 hypothetical protein [Nocardia macrotermitis]